MRKNIFALIIVTALFTSCVSQPESVVSTKSEDAVSVATIASAATELITIPLVDATTPVSAESANLPEITENKSSEDFNSKNTETINIGGMTVSIYTTELDLENKNITDITPLKYIKQLRNLNLSLNNIKDITPLAELTLLTDLNLYGNQITDVSPLAGLIHLEQLELTGNPVTDWSALTHIKYVGGRPEKETDEIFPHADDISTAELNPTVSETNPAQNYELTIIDEKTVLLNIDGKQRTLYLFKSPPEDYSNAKGVVYNFAFLSNEQNKSIPWTFVQKGDMFLDWKVIEISSYYDIFDGETMYAPSATHIKFEGEVTIKGKIVYAPYADRIDVIPNNEYLHLFPRPIYSNSFGFALRNMQSTFNEDLANGEYECELTIKDFSFVWGPYDIPHSAEFVSIEILSVIQYYDITIPY